MLRDRRPGFGSEAFVHEREPGRGRPEGRRELAEDDRWELGRRRGGAERRDQLIETLEEFGGRQLGASHGRIVSGLRPTRAVRLNVIVRWVRFRLWWLDVRHTLRQH